MSLAGDCRWTVNEDRTIDHATARAAARQLWIGRVDDSDTALDTEAFVMCGQVPRLAAHAMRMHQHLFIGAPVEQLDLSLALGRYLRVRGQAGQVGPGVGWAGLIGQV